MSNAEELAIELLLFNTGRGPVKCDPRRLAAAELRRLAQVERELEALKASIGEPVAWIRGSGMTMLKLENGGVATVYASQGMSNYSTPLYAIKEVK